MIPGRKKLNVTYEAIVFDPETDEQITGETCQDIDMVDYYADALLIGDRTGERGIAYLEAREYVEIILNANERLKMRHYISGSIKGYEDVTEREEERAEVRLDARKIAEDVGKSASEIIDTLKGEPNMEEKDLEFITRTQEIIRFRLDNGEECEVMPVKAEEDGTIYVFVDCLKEEMYMNPEDTMEGGREACFMRGYLNNEVLSHFPEELKKLLIPVNSLGDLLTLPSKEEIFGDPEDPEKQWPAMKLRRNRIAFQGLNGDPEWYWLRSVYSASWAAYVGRSGSAVRGTASLVGGVRPAFKIANR